MGSVGIAKIKPIYLVSVEKEINSRQVAEEASSVISNIDVKPDLNDICQPPLPKKFKEINDDDKSNVELQQDIQTPGVGVSADPKKLSKRERRGQNKSKNRPRVQKLANNEKLCYHYIEGPQDTPCPKLPNCDFLHDVPTYLEQKTGQISGDCYIFKTYGKCYRGLTCSFAASHIDCDNRNVVNTALWQKMQQIYVDTHKNILDNESRLKLRHKKYDFTDVEKVCSELGNLPKASDAAEVNQKNTSGPFTDEDLIIPRLPEIKKFDWKDKLYLSPLTTVGNLPFRRLCVEFGADITCSEMSLANSLLQGHAHEFGLHRRHPSEKIWGVQLCSNNVYSAAKAAQVLLDVGVDYDFVDLNLGCPLEPIYRMGAGSGLMCRGHNKLQSFMKGMSTVLAQKQKLFTVKMRAGVKSNNFTAHNLIPIFRDAGVSLITVHGRTREQRYTKTADWNYVGECAKLCNPVPLFGNGDVLSWEEYHQKKEASNVAGIMIGRGALMKPWIFQEIKEQRDIDMTSSQRLEMIGKYASYGLDHFGSDSQGVETTRRFLLEWLSFLHRYIPFGVLEQTPQKINERPPKYVGRDEMETLLASTNSKDWVKISEMFLGSVPKNFAFLPKHKANSWS